MDTLNDLRNQRAAILSKLKDLDIAAEKTRLAEAWETNDLIWGALFQMGLLLDSVEGKIYKIESAQPGYVSPLWK